MHITIDMKPNIACALGTVVGRQKACETSRLAREEALTVIRQLSKEVYRHWARTVPGATSVSSHPTESEIRHGRDIIPT